MNSSQQQSVSPQPAISTGSMLTQVSGVLTAIIILILAIAWLAKRFGFSARRNGSQQLNISASCQLGQRERVVIVDVDDARLVLGVTAHQVTHLHTLPPKPLEDVPEHTIAPADFRQVLQSLRKNYGKKP
ncbi:flagellar biosynthetic protein FliO [Erwinia amylovora]|uniref:Flagellar protein n=4 Tax=Erwinia amylovora TaxID=552 RepID=A0A831EQC2_ERWAM|nr:flagellar biosynthetic protein FliO [Erwinia amylovora]CBX80365.1 Flagellar protein FliO [Erwinia amylovora ATCC BAA-2158]CDK15009.1 Flagellar protein FliO [Erwinia amylovora LA635]CDK18377.1 Flagellar protein FliO [Erwinia amylovora LA636]CDK21746.1 Flagellar protein FliO [Erwinia amylovora LA637]ATZ11331.1 flagellar biosynthetic protein FliO [Erwinia amylovora]